jgi:hypothetical protein
MYGIIVNESKSRGTKAALSSANNKSILNPSQLQTPKWVPLTVAPSLDWNKITDIQMGTNSIHLVKESGSQRAAGISSPLNAMVYQQLDQKEAAAI